MSSERKRAAGKSDTPESLMENCDVVLDRNLLVSILTSLVNNDQKSSILLPEFRICEIMQNIKKQIKVISEIVILEAVVSIYALCLYFSMQITFNNFSLLNEFLFFCQTTSIECLRVLNCGGYFNASVGNPSKELVRDGSIEIDNLLEIFSDGMDLAKYYCRKLISLIRYVMKPKKKEDKLEKANVQAFEEAIHPRCIYFMCGFSMSYVAVILHAKRNINAFPGLLESVLLCALTCVETPSSGKKAPLSIQTQEKHEPIVPSYSLSTAFLKKLAMFVAHRVCGERDLQELWLAKGRLAKQYSHPDIAIAQFRTSAVKAYLASRISNSAAAARKEDPALYDTLHHGLLEGCDIPWYYLQNPSDPDFADNQFQSDAASRPITTASVGSDDGGVGGSLESIGSASFDLDSDSMSLASTRRSAEFRIRSMPSTAAAPQSLSGELQKRCVQFWRLSKFYRSALLVLEFTAKSFPPLDRKAFGKLFLNEYFPREYVLTPDHALVRRGLGELTVTECCQVIESQLFQSIDRFSWLPSVLNPLRDAYWSSQYIVEFLFKKTEAGYGLRNAAQQELCHLRKEMKFIGAQLKAERAADAAAPQDNGKRKTAQTALSKSVSVGSSSRGAASGRPPRESKSQPAAAPRLLPALQLPAPGSVVPRKTATRKDAAKLQPLNLQEKLALVVQKASLESRLISMEKSLERQKAGPSTHAAAPAAEGEAVGALDIDGVVLPVVSEVKPRHAAAEKSLVWHCKPKVLIKRSQEFIGVEDLSPTEHPLAHLPGKEEALLYARHIKDLKAQEEEEAVKHKLFLEDQQELIVANIKAMKGSALRQQRERIKEELHAKKELKRQMEEDLKARMVADRQQKKRELREKEELELQERMRIREIKLQKMSEQAAQKHKMDEELEMQGLKIRSLQSVQEVEEIKRRLAEEERMRYLEGRRKIIEDQLEAERLKQAQARQERMDKMAKLRDELQARVRKGNFMYHHGAFGFYDDVQPKVADWIQYEDAAGVPYYYDPISHYIQYREPQDANIRHYTEEERREYDAVHGEGAYDAWKADIAFKDGVNRDGGYWNENGLWVPVNGYYDENYEWVQHEGYVDDRGKYVKYAKIEGDLSFMV